MVSCKLTPKQTKVFAWLFILTGLPFILMSFGMITVHESTIHAQLWVIGLCGLVFSLSDVMVLLGEKSPSIIYWAAY